MTSVLGGQQTLPQSSDVLAGHHRRHRSPRATERAGGWQQQRQRCQENPAVPESWRREGPKVGGGLGSRLRGVRSDLHLSDHKEPLKASGQGRRTVRSESAGPPQGGEADASEEGDRRQGSQGGGCDKTPSEKVYVLNSNFIVEKLGGHPLKQGSS